MRCLETRPRTPSDTVERNIGTFVIDRLGSTARLQTSFDTDGKLRTGIQSGDRTGAIVVESHATLPPLLRKKFRINLTPSGCRNSFSSGSDGKATRDDLHSPDLITPIEHCKGKAKISKHGLRNSPIVKTGLSTARSRIWRNQWMFLISPLYSRIVLAFKTPIALASLWFRKKIAR